MDTGYQGDDLRIAGHISRGYYGMAAKLAAENGLDAVALAMQFMYQEGWNRAMAHIAKTAAGSLQDNIERWQTPASGGAGQPAKE